MLLVLAVVALGGSAYWLLSWDELPEPELPGVVETGVLEHDGLDRRWMTYVPAAKDVSPALVIVLHGSMSDGVVARTGTYYSFDVLAERNGFIVVYPDGVDKHWNDCRANAGYQANLLDVDDVGFLKQLVAEMGKRYGIDSARVFATGLSNGGQMAYRLAYEAPELIAAAAPVIAGLPVESNLACQPSGLAVPMLILNGTEDPVNPYEGGTVEIFGDSSRGEVLSAEGTVHYWAALAGYRGEGQRQDLPASNSDDDTTLQRLSWSEPGRVPVELITVRGGGHTFPNPLYSAPRILGPSSHQADGAELIWAFFEAL